VAGLVLLATATTTSTTTATAAEERPRFTVQGLAPVAAGQSLAQADKALGQPLQPEKPPATPEACHYRQSAAQPGVRHTLREGTLLRSETRDARYATASGLRVGDTLARAQQLYGARLVLSPHPYFDKGRSAAVYAGDKRHALVMEANDQGRIITLRAGRVPEVLSLEGCPG
jgi:hypothetical protein